MKKAIALSLAGSLALASLTDVLPRAWISLQPDSRLRFLGSLRPFAEQCTDRFAQADCKVSYRIPRERLSGPDGNLFPVLGLGFFLTDYAVRCDAEIVLRPPEDAPPSLTIDAYKTYKTVDLRPLHCAGAREISILALTRKGTATTGQISENAVAGHPDNVSAVKRTVEFLASGQYLVYFLLLFFSILAVRVLSRSFLDERRGHEPGLSYSVPAWAAFALFKSGLLEVLLLGSSSLDLLFRVQTAISLYAHSQPLLPRGVKGLDPAYLILLPYLLFMGTDYYNYYLILAILALALVRTPLALARGQWMVAAFGLCALLETIKALGIKVPISGSITLAFVTLIHLRQVGATLRSAGILAGANLWSRKMAVTGPRADALAEVLGSFAEQTGVDRVSFFVAQNSDEHLLFTYDGSSEPRFNQHHLNHVPGILGHAIATGQTLTHTRVDEAVSRRLLQDSSKPELGPYFSLLPVSSPRGLEGVIALSKYRFDPRKDVVARENLDSFIPALSEALTLAKDRRLSALNDSRLRRITLLLDDIASRPHLSDLPGYAACLMETIHAQLGWRGFFATIDRETELLQILAHSYEPDAGGRFLVETRWEMKKDNFRAPGTFSLFQGKRVMAPSVAWITDLVSANTSAFLRESGTRSICVLPVRRKTATGLESFGIIWLSSDQLGEFDSTFESGARLLQEACENQVHKIVHAAIATNVLGGPLRPDIHERILLGESPVEASDGTLVLVDMVGSTRLAQSLPPESWRRVQREFLESVRDAAKPFGLIAEMFIWDAVYLACEETKTPEELAALTEAVTLALGRQRVRICATYGDITREVRNGSWTITGHAMARVCKLEQAVKESDYLLSVSSELTSRWGEAGPLLRLELRNGETIAGLRQSGVPTAA